MSRYHWAFLNQQDNYKQDFIGFNSTFYMILKHLNVTNINHHLKIFSLYYQDLFYQVRNKDFITTEA